MQNPGENFDRQVDDGHLDRLYVSYYNLTKNPFRTGEDPRFFWLGEKQLETLAYLKRAVEENEGIIVLTGEDGSGKSVIVNCLMRVIDFETMPAVFQNFGAGIQDFLNFLAVTFRIGESAKSKGEFLGRLNAFLLNNYAENRKVVLILQNAHALDQKIVEQARLMSNMESEGSKLMSILFVGTDRFLDVLSVPENQALLQRVTTRCHLDPLSESETEAYIHHRLKAAGGVRTIFSSESIREIAELTGGNPGLINVVCDHALMKGYFDRLSVIDDKLIRRYAGEMSGVLGQDGLSDYSKKTTPKVKRQIPVLWLWSLPILAALLVPVSLYLYTGSRNHANTLPDWAEVGIIEFAPNATSLPKNAGATVDKAARLLSNNPEARLRITGYTDNVGNRDINMSISETRALMVRDALVAIGIDPKRIETLGKGPDNPIADNTTAEGRHKNRRVEVEAIR